jgi:hypothetical protein
MKKRRYRDQHQEEAVITPRPASALEEAVLPELIQSCRLRGILEKGQCVI